jgi:uncharacterized integral membrane protein
VLAAAERGLDSGWPPILIAFVALVVGAAVVSAIAVLRALRSEREAGRRKR